MVYEGELRMGLIFRNSSEAVVDTIQITSGPHLARSHQRLMDACWYFPTQRLWWCGPELSDHLASMADVKCLSGVQSPKRNLRFELNKFKFSVRPFQL